MATAALRKLAQYPLVTAALVALCGVALILLSSARPASVAAKEPQRALGEQLLQKHLRALAELRAAGATGDVDVADFGDGIGLAVSSKGAEEGAVLLTIPEALALDVSSTPSCPPAAGEAGASPDVDVAADCRVQRAVAAAVAGGKASRLTGLLTLLVLERRRGRVAPLAPSAASAVLEVLPDLQWQAKHGLFALDAEELRVLGAGTSMAGWLEAGLRKTSEAHRFMGTGALEAELGGAVGLDEVRWAYLALHARAQWTEEESLDDGVDLPSKAVFLWPLFLARPTPEWRHGVRLRYDSERRVYEAIAAAPLRPGEEVLFVDRRLSDASALCFWGLWLVGRHRARLDLDMSSVAKDPQSDPILQRYGCGGQPLRLYIQARKSVDPQFLSCMRLIALSTNASRLQHIVERSKWAKAWPETAMISRQGEALAAELAILVLQQALHRLGNSSAEIRQRFGNDPVAVRPTVRVREAETMVVVGLLTSMKELQLLSGNEYLFESLVDSTRGQRARRRRGESGPSSGSAGAGGGAAREQPARGAPPRPAR